MTSDLVVSSAGMSQFLFNWRWKELKWTDVNRIRVLSIADFERGGKLKLYVLIPREGSRFSFLPTGRLVFSEKIVELSALLELMRYQVRERHIPVEGGDLSYTAPPDRRSVNQQNLKRLAYIGMSLFVVLFLLYGLVSLEWARYRPNVPDPTQKRVVHVELFTGDTVFVTPREHRLFNIFNYGRYVGIGMAAVFGALYWQSKRSSM